MILRQATPDDRGRVIALWQATGLTRPWNDPGRDFDVALANATSSILVAEQSGGLVGSVMVGFDGHRGWVYYLAADPLHRGEGMGRELMCAAEKWLRQHGCTRLRMMVRRDNAEALGFYAAIGYDEQEVTTMGRTLD